MIITVLKKRESKNENLYIKSSDSSKTVAVRAIVPANCKKLVMNASCPVDLFLKVVKISGTDLITDKIKPDEAT